MTSEETMSLMMRVIDEKKGKDPVALNLQGISLIADYFVICHGNSETQVKAIADEIKDKAEQHGLEIKRIEGLDTARWVLIDLGDVVVHVFHREEREYYNLERLWSDAKVIENA